MLIKQYAAFVSRTDQFSRRDEADAREIAIMGLVSEIGSIVSAIKKETLKEGGALSSPLAKAELSEELGDAMWYAFALARIEDQGDGHDILISDIAHLKDEIGVNNTRGVRIRTELSEPEVEAFFEGARVFERSSHRKISDYQELAFRTARTQGGTLLTVCAAVLAQLGAQLMRHLLPPIEIELNTQIKDRPINVVLGEIAWHLSAVASLYKIDMDDVAVANMKKAGARQRDGAPTELHDRKSSEAEQLPRRFVVEFRTVDEDTVQMYWNNEKLGDPLRDQYTIKDGYRFHDVLHLANAATLGWSPVLRDLMGIKRSSCPETKQAEDGGRSAVIEELVIKLIHWEASRRAKELHGNLSAYERPLFPVGEEIPFSLIKQVRDLTAGHEVYANKFWEWERAIREGYRLFQNLKDHRAGRVIVDLNKRDLCFEPLSAHAA